jgi:hypothetical protein
MEGPCSSGSLLVVVMAGIDCFNFIYHVRLGALGSARLENLWTPVDHNV